MCRDALSNSREQVLVELVYDSSLRLQTLAVRVPRDRRLHAAVVGEGGREVQRLALGHSDTARSRRAQPGVYNEVGVFFCVCMVL